MDKRQIIKQIRELITKEKRGDILIVGAIVLGFFAIIGTALVVGTTDGGGKALIETEHVEEVE